ncbi:Reticulocyte-binding protein 2 homolog a [Durusdinium trenchii]|uniref:Reticulocyte-binding protein 2 homolog a n=1 Tax=Durusdinium trenchii TaxID=1381693 RepID=A0ABP0JZH6_9DINO
MARLGLQALLVVVLLLRVWHEGFITTQLLGERPRRTVRFSAEEDSNAEAPCSEDEAATMCGALDHLPVWDPSNSLEHFSPGLVKFAALCDVKEKWKAIAQHVGTRDVRACAERFKVCRQRALEQQRAQEKEEEEEEEEEEDDEEEEEQEPRHDWRQDDWKQWRGDWWSDWKWHESSDRWKEETPEDDAERRKWEVQQEIEANRRKLQHKEVQKQREEELREAKLRAEREQKEKERQEQQAAREQKILDAKEREAQRRQEEERLKRFMQQKREEEDAQAGFYGTRHLNMKGARGFKGGKAGKGVKKGDIQRQLREQEMERRAREVLANIGSTRSAEIGDRNSSDVERGVAGSTSKGDARNGGGDRVEESAAQPLSSGRETASDMKDGPVTLGGKNKDGKGKTVKKGGKKERKTDEARTSEKDRWWTKIDGDCPISLIPIAELPVPPFTLKASGSSVPHYFDARFLASFLLSSFDFMNPVNRSPLNREDCVALDVHLRQFYPDSSSSVTDAYDLFQRNGGNGSDAVRREATAVFQHLFRFQPRNLDSRGRAINYNDGALTVIDDDDIRVSAAQHTVASTAEALGRGGSDAVSVPGPGPHRVASAPLSGAWPEAKAAANRPVVEEFPALPGAKPKAKAPKAKAKAAKAKAAPVGRSLVTPKTWAKPP